MTIEDAAKELAGNWRKFDSFAWFRQDELDDPQNWGLVYTHNRDSRLLDESNAAVIAKRMSPFSDENEDLEDPDVVFESHSHFAVGHVDGFSIRVFRDGEITPAFVEYYRIQSDIDAYPILDDEDYYKREYEATLANIKDAGWMIIGEYDLPEDWEHAVYEWISENTSCGLENVDDQGGYPEEEDLRAAVEALGYPRAG